MKNNFLFGFSILAIAAITIAAKHSYLSIFKSNMPDGNPVAVNEDINQTLIESGLSRSEDDLYQKNEDISDLAEETASLTAYDISKDLVLTDGLVSFKNLNLYNVNTNEQIKIVYSINGEYVEPSINKLDNFMRDWRKNQVTDIDIELYDLLHKLHENLDAETPIHLTSGYRSKQTNDYLRQLGLKTARKSQHVKGKAADITIPGVPVDELKEKAVEIGEGGVGYYPNQNFIHVDTGPRRQW